MKIDKKMIDMLLKMNDEQLWKTIQLIGSKSGVEKLRNMEKPKDMSKLRSTLSQLTNEDIAKAVEAMKRSKSDE